MHNENDKMVNILLFSDAEGSILRNEKNSRNLKPEQLDKNERYPFIFNNIFDLAATKTTQAAEKLQGLLKNGTYRIT